MGDNNKENSGGQESDLEIYTPDDMLLKGLQCLGWEKEKIGRVQRSTNVGRFRDLFGARPEVLAQIWEDLQVTDVAEANINHGLARKSLKEFFMAMHFLKRYPTESEREQMWKVSENTLRLSGWFYVERIRALKKEKIKWPSDNFGNDIWAIAVDGVHFQTEEIAHPTQPKDPAIYSYKYNCAGFIYEFAVALATSDLVWMNGPFEAGTYNDAAIFKKKGLKDKLISTGKKAIADGGYRGYPKIVSTPNSYDSDEVKLFKSRARQRNEKFNGTMKTFECLSSRFRHSKERLQCCVEAVAVVVQCMMELGEPLYDI
jgi:hypothetical protein